MDIGVVLGQLAQAGMVIEETGVGYVEGKVRTALVGLVTDVRVRVWSSGMVVVERTRRLEASPRKERLLGRAVDVSGASTDQSVWCAQLDQPGEVLRLVEMANGNGRRADNGQPGNASAGRQPTGVSVVAG